MGIDVVMLAIGLLGMLIFAFDKENNAKAFLGFQKFTLWSFVVFMTGLGVCGIVLTGI